MSKEASHIGVVTLFWTVRKCGPGVQHEGVYCSITESYYNPSTGLEIAADCKVLLATPAGIAELTAWNSRVGVEVIVPFRACPRCLCGVACGRGSGTSTTSVGSRIISSLFQGTIPARWKQSTMVISLRAAAAAFTAARTSIWRCPATPAARS